MRRCHIDEVSGRGDALLGAASAAAALSLPAPVPRRGWQSGGGSSGPAVGESPAPYAGQAAGRDGPRRTGTPLKIDWPMIGSTTESSTQSLMDTPAWLPATFC